MNEILQTPVVGTESNTATMDFDISLSEDEKRFYMKAYPNVDMVCERKVHCTVCKMHIGTAPAQEAVIRMHPVLRVTHCSKCHDFYNSGEFSKGEDGSELYCRWCGQGGEVYCCSSCPYVFCKSCILKNLTRGVVVDIEQNENWSCFNCAPKILWPLRAQHWALTKYISKQKKLIASINLSESEFKINMTKDRSSCCRLAKAKCGNMSDSMESLDSASRRSVNSNNSINNKRTQKVAIRVQSPVPKRVKPNDEVVCTPDLLSMLEPDCQITVKTRSGQSPVTSAPKVMSIENPSALQCSVSKNTPPPLVLRNTSIQMRPTIVAPITRRTVVGPRAPSPSGSAPVYHTIGGYRIDLNTAAQQETFRLPNGKLIQVKRQGSSNSQTTHTISTASIQTPVHWQRSTPTHSPVMQVTQPQSNSQQQYQQITIPQQQQHPQLVRYQKSIVGNTTVTAIPNRSSAPIQVINSAPTASIAAVPIQATTTSAALRPQMLRHVFPDTAIGQARSQLQEQVFGAMDICAHLSGKVMTLTNSNAYKQARNYLEVKELYIHLSYLLTYAIGRFKGLQDKCLNDMRQLGFVNDADSLENGQLAAGVDYVRYAQIEDVELFNTGCNSFHNQVYEYRKSLHSRLQNDGGGNEEQQRPLSPFQPLGTCFVDDDADNDDDNGHDHGDDNELSGNELLNDDDNSGSLSNYHAGGDDENTNNTNDREINDDDDCDNMSRLCGGRGSGGGSSGGGAGEEVLCRMNENHAIDRKLTRLIEQYPAIWCTRHPDYGILDITRKQWQVLAAYFKRSENIKLRWKNIRKRFVRIEERLKMGKRFTGYFDKATNFLINRNLPENNWIKVDKGDTDNDDDDDDDDDNGDDNGDDNDDDNDNNIEKNDVLPDITTNNKENNNSSCGRLCEPIILDDDDDKNQGMDFRSYPVKPIEIDDVDMKIINFVKCNPVLWRKANKSTANKIDDVTRKSLWMHLWKQIPEMDCEDLIDRWSYLYEMYKTFRLKNIKDETKLANLEVKYSIYLATLHFLYKIDEEELKNENFIMEDYGHLDDLPECNVKFQDMADDREFITELVCIVYARPLLWNQNHIDYNNTFKREQMWKDIQHKLKHFKRDIKTIKLRWQLAKFCYRRWLREKGKLPKNRLANYFKNLPIEKMKFLNGGGVH